MKLGLVAALFALTFNLPVVAQTTPSSNASAAGTATTSGNGAGMPSAATPAGQIATSTSVGPAPSAASVPLLQRRVHKASRQAVWLHPALNCAG